MIHCQALITVVRFCFFLESKNGNGRLVYLRFKIERTSPIADSENQKLFDYIEKAIYQIKISRIFEWWTSWRKYSLQAQCANNRRSFRTSCPMKYFHRLLQLLMPIFKISWCRLEANCWIDFLYAIKIFKDNFLPFVRIKRFDLIIFYLIAYSESADDNIFFLRSFYLHLFFSFNNFVGNFCYQVVPLIR